MSDTSPPTPSTVRLWDSAWTPDLGGQVLVHGQARLNYALGMGWTGPKGAAYRLGDERQLRQLEAEFRVTYHDPDDVVAWLGGQDLSVSSTEKGVAIYYTPPDGQRVFRGAGLTLKSAVLDWAHRL